MQRPINTRMGKLWNIGTMEYHLAMRITDQQLCTTTRMRDFPGGPEVKNLPCNAGDASSISGQGTKLPPCHGATKPVHYNYQSPWTTNTEPSCHNYRVRVPTTKDLRNAMKTSHSATKTQHSQINI